MWLGRISKFWAILIAICVGIGIYAIPSRAQPLVHPNQQTPSYNWSSPQAVTTNHLNQDQMQFYAPNYVMTGDGTAYMLWEQAPGGSTVQPQAIYVSRNLQGQWSAPALVVQAMSLTLVGAYVDTNQHVHVVYTTMDSQNNLTFYETVQNSWQNWSSGQASPALAINWALLTRLAAAYGKVAMVGLSVNDNQVIYADGSQGWGAWTKLGNGSSPSLLILPDGSSLVYWQWGATTAQMNNQSYYATNLGGAWSSPHNLAALGSTRYDIISAYLDSQRQVHFLVAPDFQVYGSNQPPFTIKDVHVNLQTNQLTVVNSFTTQIFTSQASEYAYVASQNAVLMVVPNQNTHALEAQVLASDGTVSSVQTILNAGTPDPSNPGDDYAASGPALVVSNTCTGGIVIPGLQTSIPASPPWLTSNTISNVLVFTGLLPPQPPPNTAYHVYLPAVYSGPTTSQSSCLAYQDAQ